MTCVVNDEVVCVSNTRTDHQAQVLMSERQGVAVKEARGLRVQRIPQVALEIVAQHQGETVQAPISKGMPITRDDAKG